MWFKQIQYFQLSDSFEYGVENLENQLAALAFKPCLPSLPASAGWIPPVDSNDTEETSLVWSLKNYRMICVH